MALSLRTRGGARLGEMHTGGSHQPLDEAACFVLFRERAPGDGTVIDAAISLVGGSAALVHCELAWIRPDNVKSTRLFFSSYITGICSGGARWSLNDKGSMSYYLVDGGVHWRAIPIFGVSPLAIRQISERCGLPKYSFVQYATTCRPFRVLGSCCSKRLHAPAHCASLVARILLSAGYSSTITSHPSTYSPSRLYFALENSKELREATTNACRTRVGCPSTPLSTAIEDTLFAAAGAEDGGLIRKQKQIASALLIHNFRPAVL